jgi:hypothetical protein
VVYVLPHRSGIYRATTAYVLTRATVRYCTNELIVTLAHCTRPAGATRDETRDGRPRRAAAAAAGERSPTERVSTK